MHFPTWVDLKGQDTVPETVHHVVCYVDPVADTLWHSLSQRVSVSIKAGCTLGGGQAAVVYQLYTTGGAGYSGGQAAV